MDEPVQLQERADLVGSYEACGSKVAALQSGRSRDRTAHTGAGVFGGGPSAAREGPDPDPPEDPSPSGRPGRGSGTARDLEGVIREMSVDEPLELPNAADVDTFCPCCGSRIAAGEKDHARNRAAVRALAALEGTPPRDTSWYDLSLLSGVVAFVGLSLPPLMWAFSHVSDPSIGTWMALVTLVFAVLLGVYLPVLGRVRARSAGLDSAIERERSALRDLLDELTDAVLQQPPAGESRGAPNE